MRIACIETEAEMRDLMPEWTALWQRVPGATPFQSPAWLAAWWRQFGTGAPRILTARTEVLAGVLPLYELAETGRRKLLPIGIGLSDYVDALADGRATAETLLQAIGDVPGWQECHLPDLPAGGLLAGALGPAGFGAARQRTVPCPVLTLPGVSADLHKVVPHKTLRDVRQAEARAMAAGGVRTEAVESGGIDDALADLFRLHAARWSSRGEPGVLADPAVQAFHREAARALGATGMLRLYRLWICSKVAAVYYGLAWRDRAYAYIGGFDPAMPRLSPGAQIMRHAIAAAAAEGCAEFHFLRGGERYKYAWGAADRWNTAVTLRRQ